MSRSVYTVSTPPFPRHIAWTNLPSSLLPSPHQPSPPIPSSPQSTTFPCWPPLLDFLCDVSSKTTGCRPQHCPVQHPAAKNHDLFHLRRGERGRQLPATTGTHARTSEAAQRSQGSGNPRTWKASPHNGERGELFGPAAAAVSHTLDFAPSRHVSPPLSCLYGTPSVLLAKNMLGVAKSPAPTCEALHPRGFPVIMAVALSW